MRSVRLFLVAATALAGFATADEDHWRRLAKAARKKGLRGYDLVEACDTFHGRDTPDFESVIDLLNALAKSNDGKVTEADFEAIGIPAEHFRWFDRNHDKVFSPDEAYAWFMQRKGAREMDLTETSAPPKGHMKPLGSWKAPLPSEDLVYRKPFPHPRDFWKKHMDGYLPAVLKGAQEGWPAMEWDRDTLKEKFGWVDAKIEPKREGRGNDTAYRDLEALAPKHRLNISEYLRKEAGKDIYVVSIIPQAMAWEVAHPSPLLCGSRSVMVNKRAKPPYKMTDHEYPNEAGHSWMTHLMEANLWLSSGGTVSQLHYDKEWNVHCSLRGTKRWVFINPFEADGELQWARGDKFLAQDPLNNRWTDWVYLEAESVDLIAQNKLRNLDYYELIQEPGDCIFIPYAMLHQVTSVDKGMQVSASWMFLPETVYDERACSQAPLSQDMPLAAMDTLYMYTGKGIIPQGYSDPIHMVHELQQTMREKGETHLTLGTFRKRVTRGDASLARGSGSKKRVKEIFKLLTARAEDPSKGLRVDELAKIPLRIWCKPAAEGDEEGPLPCDVGEVYNLIDDEAFEEREKYIREVLDKHGKREATGSPPQEAPPRIWRPKRPGTGRGPQQEL